MTSEVKLSEQIKKVPPAVRSTVATARRVVRATAPKAREVAYGGERPRSRSMMWKLARYAVDDELVVGLGTFSDHAALYFFRGRELDEEPGLLEGSGKRFRYITLRAPADAERPAVRRLVRKAFALALRD